MTRVNPRLSFNDNYREAIIFHKDCIGGELILTSVGESALAAQRPRIGKRRFYIHL